MYFVQRQLKFLDSVIPSERLKLVPEVRPYRADQLPRSSAHSPVSVREEDVFVYPQICRKAYKPTRNECVKVNLYIQICPVELLCLYTQQPVTSTREGESAIQKWQKRTQRRT